MLGKRSSRDVIDLTSSDEQPPKKTKPSDMPPPADDLARFETRPTSSPPRAPKRKWNGPGQPTSLS